MTVYAKQLALKSIIWIVDGVMKLRCYTDYDHYGCLVRTNSTSVVDKRLCRMSLVVKSDALQLVWLCGELEMVHRFKANESHIHMRPSVQQHRNEKNLRVQFDSWVPYSINRIIHRDRQGIGRDKQIGK